MKRIILLVLWCLIFTSVSEAQILGDVVDSFTDLGNEQRMVSGKRATVVHQSDEIDAPFTGVAVEVGTFATHPEAFFRFLEDGTWSTWFPAHITPSATGGTLVAGYRQDAPMQASRFEFKMQVDSADPAEVRNGGVFNNAFDEDARIRPVESSFEGSQSGGIIPPHLITRAQWGAQPFRLGSPSPLSSRAYEFMTMHHAAGYSAETEAEGKAQMRAMQDLHQNVRGWSDIGYQFAIDRGGRLYQGRPFLDNSTSLSQVPKLAMGAHVGERNTGNIGIVIMGCYHPPEPSYSCIQQMTPAAYATYRTLFAFLSERYGVAPTLIRGHRDFSQTSCPGDNNYVLLPALRTEVAQLLITGNEPLGSAEMTASPIVKGKVDLSWTLSEDLGIDSLYVERVTSLGTSRVVDNAFLTSSYTDASLLGETKVTYLLIATAAGDKRQELSRLDIEIADPNSYVLTNVFPNPAQDQAQIRFYLSVEGLTSLSLYDPSGRRIDSWELGFLSEDEWYTRPIRLEGLSSGTYFVRLEVSGFSGIAFDKIQTVHVVR